MSLKDAGRGEYGTRSENATHEEINTGNMQRIADACELMARGREKLVRDYDYVRHSRDYWRGQAEHLKRSLSATRGVVTKLKKVKS